MEVLTIVLASLLPLFSAAGFVLDKVAAAQVRDRIESADTLVVRVDNTPTHQILSGRVDRVRVASRGLELIEGVEVTALELETDPIRLDLDRLNDGREALEEPLRAAVRLVISRDDLLNALQSPTVAERLSRLTRNLPGAAGTEGVRYEFVDPQVSFLENNRIQISVTLRDPRSQQTFTILAAAGVGVAAGHQIQLIDPAFSVNNQPLPAPLLLPLTQSLNRSLDLKQLEEDGIVARILRLEVKEEEVAIAAFVQVNPLDD